MLAVRRIQNEKDAERYQLWRLGLTEDEIATVLTVPKQEVLVSITMSLHKLPSAEILAARNLHLANRIHMEFEGKSVDALRELLEGREEGWKPRNAGLELFRKIVGLDVGQGAKVNVNVNQQTAIVGGQVSTYEQLLTTVREAVRQEQAVANPVASPAIDAEVVDNTDEPT